MYKLICALMVSCVSLTSCCTVSRGRFEPVKISSAPGDAHITIDGYACGSTPQIFELTRKDAHEIILEKEGYEPQRFILKSTMSPSICGNALFPVGGTAIGAGVGAAMGARSFVLLPIIGLGALVGLGVGVAVGAVATGLDLVTGSSCALSQNQVHGILQPQYFWDNSKATN